MKSLTAVASLLTFCLLLASPSTGWAQCTTGATNESPVAFIRSFGTMFEDLVDVAYGESFVIDCDAQLTSCEATLRVPSYEDLGHLPLAVGDSVVCTVYDSGKVAIMSELITLPSNDSTQEISFDFSAHEFRLAAGQYYFLLSTPQDRWTYLALGTEYADGEAQQFMLDTWTAQSGDTMFNLQWDPTSDLVANEEASFGTMKAMYR